MDRRRVAVLHGAGLAAVDTLPALLPEWSLVRPWRVGRDTPERVLAWGRKPSAVRAEAWALARGLPLTRLEDGFLRSVGLGDAEPPWSIVVDDLGIYYDAGAPSRLEQLIASPIDAAQSARAQALAVDWRNGRVSKYNSAREANRAGPFDGAVLVVDQTAGDASIAFGQADAGSFRRMLEAALDEHPGRRVLLKVHPDVSAGRKKGHFDEVPASWRERLTWLADPVHPPSLLERVAEVYVVTSQMGFEALLWGRRVRCFGMPFYAGWGLTADELAAPVRRGAASFDALVHAALVEYPRYLDPDTGRLATPELLLGWMTRQRLHRERFSPTLAVAGFQGWKRGLLRRYLAGSDLRFVSSGERLAPGEDLVLWGQNAWLPDGQGPSPQRVLRVEDGFLRSVGLGADLVRPLSWVIDRQGLYYDASAPSELETLLRTTDFTPELRARAADLRRRIVALGLTKYNLGGPAWVRPAGRTEVVLVVGQVESDAAILYGAPGVRTNLELLRQVRQARPEAWLVYKPHPDVVSGLRRAGQGERSAASLCNEVLTQADMHQLFGLVDEVHVLTSLAGFEALLRGVKVVTWGCPFYAGWGLTDDRWRIDRRDRQLDLDSLVAAALLLYPTYVSRRTGHFTTPELTLDELEAWQREVPQRVPTLLKRMQRWVLRVVVDLNRRRSTTRRPGTIDARPVTPDHD